MNSLPVSSSSPHVEVEADGGGGAEENVAPVTANN